MDCGNGLLNGFLVSQILSSQIGLIIIIINYYNLFAVPCSLFYFYVLDHISF